MVSKLALLVEALLLTLPQRLQQMEVLVAMEAMEALVLLVVQVVQAQVQFQHLFH
jgi:hypothetical protein